MHVDAHLIVDGPGESAAWLRAHVDHSGDECLTWPFSSPNGYGMLVRENRTYYAHRLMCEQMPNQAFDFAR